MSTTSTELMFAKQPTADTNPITANNSLAWKFGPHTIPMNIPVEIHEYQPTYLGGRDPNSIDLIKKKVEATIAYSPVNGVGWYWFLGNSTNQGGDVHLIQGLQTGDIPRIAIRYEDTGGAAALYHTALDLRCRSFSFNLDLQNDAAMTAAVGQSFIGKKIDDTTLQAAHTGAKYPTDDGLLSGTQRSGQYRKDSSFDLTWDYDGDNVSMKSALRLFSYTGVNLLKESFIQNQAELDDVFSGKRTHSLKWLWARGVDTSMIDDFLADNKKDIRLTIYNVASTYYQIIDFSTVAIQQPVGNLPMYHTEEEAAWDIEAILKSVDVLCDDGIDKTVFYDD